MFPNKIKEFIQNYKVTEITDYHRSGDFVYNIENKYILKVSNDLKRLENEYQKDLWINQYLKSPKPIYFLIENNISYYLREYLEGEVLCIDKYLSNPTLLIDLLVEALNLIHHTKVDNHKYILDEGYNVLIHGDFCLPNILIKDSCVNGFIDLGDCGIGDPWKDYAWCIWSLEYNLGTNQYTHLLLDKLGIEFNKEKYNKYVN